MDILEFFSENIKNVLLKNIDIEIYKSIEEIRLRNNRKIIIKLFGKSILIDYIVTSEDLLETLELICKNSIYSFQSQICSRIYNN